MKKWLFSLCVAAQLQSGTAQVVVGTLLTNVNFDNLTADALGNLYASNYTSGGVNKVAPDGTVSAYAPGIPGAAGSVFDGAGHLYVASYTTGNLYQVPPGGGAASVFAALGAATGPAGLAIDSVGNVYVACSGSQAAPLSIIKRISPTGVVSDFATGSPVTWYSAGALAFDGLGNLYVAGYANSKIYRIAPGGPATLLVNLPGAGTSLGYMRFLDDHLYVSQFGTNQVYRIDLQGNAMVFAGSGTMGSADGPALQASFEAANGLAFSPGGDTLFISEFDGHRLRYATGFTSSINEPTDQWDIQSRLAAGRLEIEVGGLPIGDTQLCFQLHNIGGQLQWAGCANVLNGRCQASFEVPRLPVGIYALTVRSGAWARTSLLID